MILRVAALVCIVTFVILDSFLYYSILPLRTRIEKLEENVTILNLQLGTMPVSDDWTYIKKEGDQIIWSKRKK